jgi:hypothetical protein
LILIRKFDIAEPGLIILTTIGTHTVSVYPGGPWFGPYCFKLTLPMNWAEWLASSTTQSDRRFLAKDALDNWVSFS